MDVIGHIIDDQGLKASPEKIARIEAWTTTKNKKQLQEFAGVVKYISQFIQHLASDHSTPDLAYWNRGVSVDCNT